MKDIQAIALLCISTNSKPTQGGKDFNVSRDGQRHSLQTNCQNEMAAILQAILSDYETMLDFEGKENALLTIKGARYEICHTD